MTNIPAIKGQIGNTIYYIANLTFFQIATMVSRVNDELHTANSMLNSSYKCNGIHINNLFKFFVWCEVSKSFTRSII